MARTRPKDLPDYATPPVIEVAIGAHFEELALETAHVGEFWHRIRDQYPKTRDLSPLPVIFERFDGAQDSDPGVEVVERPPLRRVWFLDESDQWVLQLQGERLIHNWRQSTEGNEYPHFEACFDRFNRAWKAFEAYCSERKLGAPAISQLEVTYINHIPAGTVWTSPADVGRILPDISWRTGSRVLPAPERIAWTASFRLPMETARLHITVRHAIRNRDKVPVLLCELTVRGEPKAMSVEDWIFEARRWIVKGFEDITDRTAQDQLWGLRK